LTNLKCIIQTTRFPVSPGSSQAETPYTIFYALRLSPFTIKCWNVREKCGLEQCFNVSTEYVSAGYHDTEKLKSGQDKYNLIQAPGV